MDCRFNKTALIKRIRLIAEQKNQISLLNLDALELIEKIQRSDQHKDSIFYFDPPYYLQGASLYMSHYKNEQHEAVSKAILNIEDINWIVSYDDDPNIEKIYSWVPDFRKVKYAFNHSAHKAREGKEILFFSKGLLFSEEFLPTYSHQTLV